MSPGESERKAARVSQLLALLDSSNETNSRDTDTFVFWVPGRIEVLGKHTDYGGGRSLLCAVERGICIVARAMDAGGATPRVRIRDANSGESAELSMSAGVAPVPGHWSNYAITVVRRIASNFTASFRGADIVFASDLPHAAGVSSSSALVVALFLALSAVNDLASTPEYRRNIHDCEGLAGFLGCLENGLGFGELSGRAGVGTFGGSEDQTAILCARPSSVSQFSFCPVTFERAVPLPIGYSFLIASSGILAEKTGAALSQYNRVSQRLRACLAAWNRATGRDDQSMSAALASSNDAERIREVLGNVADGGYPAASLLSRFEQFRLETSVLIPAAGDALEREDMIAFGELVAQSQSAAETGLQNQVPETVALVAQAREIGAVAASAFGAGFGGSVWALVPSSELHAFMEHWSARYANEFPDAASRAEFFATRAGPPAMPL